MHIEIFRCTKKVIILTKHFIVVVEYLSIMRKYLYETFGSIEDEFI